MTEQEKESFGIHPREIIAILYRRRRWLLLPILIGFLAACAVIYFQKPMYRSSATLLINSQQIPTSLVASPLTSIANERIAKIRQQIVSRDSLLSIIHEYKLYVDERQELPIETVLEIMRNAIGVDLVGANEGNANSGSTIAFTLSFTYTDPAVARAVTDTVSKMFLVEDKRDRTEQATGTAAFLGRRSDELRRQLSKLEEKRREVEARYAGALPSNVALSVQSGAALRAEISRIDAETQGLVQQNSLLAARSQDIAQAPPPGIEGLRRAEERVNQLAAVYSDDFPELVAARAAAERQRESLARSRTRDGSSMVETEIASGHSRIQMLAHRRSELVEAVADIEHRTAQAPQAAYELNMIEREYDNIKRQYESLREKQLDAQVAANLQSEDKGERFTIVEEPSMPSEPLGTKPFALLIGGLLAGAVVGAALVLAFELLTGTIHGESSLTRILDKPPLGIVPMFQDAKHPSQIAYALIERLQAQLLRLTGGSHAS